MYMQYKNESISGWLKMHMVGGFDRAINLSKI